MVCRRGRLGETVETEKAMLSEHLGGARRDGECRAMKRSRNIGVSWVYGKIAKWRLLSQRRDLVAELGGAIRDRPLTGL